MIGRGCRENLRRGKTRGERARICSHRKEEYLLLFISTVYVSLPGLYMTYIQILIPIISDGSKGEEERKRGREEERKRGEERRGDERRREQKRREEKSRAEKRRRRRRRRRKGKMNEII